MMSLFEFAVKQGLNAGRKGIVSSETDTEYTVFWEDPLEISREPITNRLFFDYCCYQSVFKKQDFKGIYSGCI